MDLIDKDSKQKLLDHLNKEHSGYDVLVQNAAIAFKNAATEPFHEQAEITLRTNFWGNLGMFQKFIRLFNVRFFTKEFLNYLRIARNVLLKMQAKWTDCTDEFLL